VNIIASPRYIIASKEKGIRLILIEKTEKKQMRSCEYREIIRRISKSAFRKRFPGLKQKEINEVANTIAINVHARMYGANVEGVESPLWRIEEPTVEAKELLGTQS